MAAYGEYLLVDPGYYKPNDLDNARTSGPTSHSVVLVDGAGAPDKGLLTDFGDTDAFLENWLDGDIVTYAEAWQSYEQVDIERSVAMVRGRYFVIGDRIVSSVADDRLFTWRLHGNAGHEAGGTFSVRPDGADWVRDAAGVAVHLASTAPGLVSAEAPFSEWDSPSVHEFDRDRNVGHHGVLDGSVSASDPGFLAIVAPYRAGGTAPEVTAIPAPEGVAAWAVEVDGSLDVVLLREPGAPSVLTLPAELGGTVVETDGELAIVATDGLGAVVARGSSASLDGAAQPVVPIP